MAVTYTYTARSADDPSQIVTFTLDGRSLSLASPTPRLLYSAAIDTQEIKPAAAPTASSADVIDVSASVAGADLRVSAWGRWHDQRWRLSALMLEHVDNPEAARAFVAELNRRKILALQQTLVAAWLKTKGRWFLAGVGIALLAVIAVQFKPGRS